MSKEHVTFLKSGGYLRITEYTEKEYQAEANRKERVWMKKEGILAMREDDIRDEDKKSHPYNTPTEMKQYAPSCSLKARLTVFLRNLGAVQWEWSL